MPNNSFRKVKVDKRSGFDKSFRNTLTGKCGTLVPILVDEWCPDTKVHLKEAIAAALPPLVSDTYMNVRLRVEAFVVPHRLCQGNFDEFYSDYPVETIDAVNVGSGYDFNSPYKGCMPLIRLNDTGAVLPASAFANGTLADYFGIPVFADYYDFDVVLAPFVAYHLIWQEWYRNPRVQKPAFMKPDSSFGRMAVGGTTLYAATIPYFDFYFNNNNSQPVLAPYSYSGTDYYDNYLLADNTTYIWDLRQRNFGLDFFTAAMVEPQQGDVARVVIEAGSGGAPDTFTISALRAQNSIQQFRERNNLTSPRYQQQIYARYGVAPSDGVIQRPVLIGAATYDVYSHGVVSTMGADGEVGVQSNPFGGYLGQRGGNGFASGSDFIIEDFHCKEPMYVIVLASLVPEVTYSQNMNFIWLRYRGVGSITDMANGILQNVGPQAIPKGMLGMAGSLAQFNQVFAYTDRYADWMIKVNEAHGEMKTYQNGTLHSFVSQRTFSALPSFGSSFLEIPTDYLDDVMQVTTAAMGLTYWLDIAFDYKVSMPLQEYAIPSLQDPGYEHGRTITLRKNGQLL